jgi:hypothetical protein
MLNATLSKSMAELNEATSSRLVAMTEELNKCSEGAQAAHSKLDEVEGKVGWAGRWTSG